MLSPEKAGGYRHQGNGPLEQGCNAYILCLSFLHFRLGGSWLFPNNKDSVNLDIPNNEKETNICPMKTLTILKSTCR